MSTTYTALRAATGTAPTTAPRRARDPLLQNDNNGAWRFLADFGFNWSYGGASPVAADAVVRDVAELADGAVRIAASSPAPTIAGNGLNFAPTDRGTNVLEAPASVLSTILANNQQFLVMAYMRLPAAADWGLNRIIIGSPLFQLRTTISNSVNQLQFRRLETGGTWYNLTFSPVTTSVHNALAQIAFWRDANELGFRLRTASGAFGNQGQGPLSGFPGPRGDNNTDVTTGAVTNFGVVSWATPYDANQLLARDMRLFRCGIAIPQRLTGTYADLLDADWTRTVARGVFS